MDAQQQEAYEERLALVVRHDPAAPVQMDEEEVRVRSQYAATRLGVHLKQKARFVEINDENWTKRGATNVELFGGQLELPGLPGDPWQCSAQFPIMSSVVNGKMRKLVVNLRVWQDMSLKDAIDLNVGMLYSATVNESGQPVIKIKKDTQIAAVVCVVIMWLRLRGMFFWEVLDGNSSGKDSSRSLWFDNKSRELMRIGSDEFVTWFQGHSNILKANDRVYKQVMDGVRTASTNPDVSQGVTPGNLFDRRGNVIYVSCGDSDMARIKDGEVEMVPNGTDGVLFAKGATLRPWNLLEKDQGIDPFVDTQIFGGANYESLHGRMILRLWVLGLFGCIKNYPALLAVGRYRSGKSKLAEMVLELLGTSTNLGAMRKNGEDDFWAIVNAGGVKCFDNVDSHIPWLADDLQIVCTGGGTEKRQLFTDSGIVVQRGKARIILTSNNPQFAADCGLSDRLQTVFLAPFVNKSGKVAKDSELTEEIREKRDAALTWMCYTVAAAMQDDKPVVGNVNRRHPDYAAFALRCSRALSRYDEGVEALRSAEFSKSMISLQNDRLANYIYEALRMELKEKGAWAGTSTDLLTLIKNRCEVDTDDKMISNRAVGRVMVKIFDNLRTCFTGSDPKQVQGKTTYSFNGFTPEYSLNVKEVEEDDKNSADKGVEDVPPEF